MTETAKQKLKYWIIGLFTGGAIATPVTAFVAKKVYEKKIDEAETRGMNAMAEYVISEKPDISAPQQPEQKNDIPMTEEDYAEPTSYDLSFDNEEDVNEEEAKERTEAHARYMDMIDKYNGNDDIHPHIISADEFNNEQYMTKTYVNWYADDNVFEEGLNVIEDPFMTFGVTSGKELFKDADLRPDPDICYVRNERVTTDFEISRIRGSYAKMVGGEAALGETDT